MAEANRETPDTKSRTAMQTAKRACLQRDALAAWHHYQETGLYSTAEEVDTWLARLEAGEPAEPPQCHR